MGEEPKNEYELARIRTWNLLIRSQTRYPLRHKPRDEKWHSSQTIHTRRPCVSDLLFVWREIWTECCTVWQIRLISRAFCSNLYPIWMIRAFVHHSYWISFLRECFVWPTWLIHAYLKVYWMTIGVRLELWSQPKLCHSRRSICINALRQLSFLIVLRAKKYDVQDACIARVITC